MRRIALPPSADRPTRVREQFFFSCDDEEEHTLSGLEEGGRSTYRDGSLSRAVFPQPEEESSP
jgi:hypothetical protein